MRVVKGDIWEIATKWTNIQNHVPFFFFFLVRTKSCSLSAWDNAYDEHCLIIGFVIIILASIFLSQTLNQ